MKNLNQEEFNKLSIDHQVQYFNDRLDEKSVTKICNDIGIARSTVSKRFKSNGYILDPEKNLYVQDNTFNTDNTKESSSNPIFKKSEGSINLAYIQGLESQITDLKGKYDSIVDVIKKTINPKNTDIEELGLRKFEGELVSRVYKIDKEVSKEFVRFCKRIQIDNEDKDFRISDIISSILADYMKNHK